MNSLTKFIEAHPSHSEYDETWPLDPPIPLRVRLGLASVLPPLEVRSSILAIVSHGADQVLFIHPAQPSGDIAHLIPGGRPEPGETPEQTLIREVGEETGWRVTPKGIVGFRHLRHLGPILPSMSDRPYPNFIQAIYAATADAFDERLLLPGEPPCELVDATWAERVTRPEHRLLLAAALQLAARSQD